MRVQGNVYDITTELRLIRSVNDRKRQNDRLNGLKDRRPKVKVDIHPAVKLSQELENNLENYNKKVEEKTLPSVELELEYRRIILALEAAVAGQQVKPVSLDTDYWKQKLSVDTKINSK
jgi:hypothetical protein